MIFVFLNFSFYIAYRIATNFIPSCDTTSKHPALSNQIVRSTQKKRINFTVGSLWRGKVGDKVFHLLRNFSDHAVRPLEIIAHLLRGSLHTKKVLQGFCLSRFSKAQEETHWTYCVEGEEKHKNWETTKKKLNMSNTLLKL